MAFAEIVELVNSIFVILLKELVFIEMVLLLNTLFYLNQIFGQFSDDTSSEIASFFDPFGNAVHSINCFNIIGEDLLITGAGPIGLISVAICKFIELKISLLLISMIIG